MKGRSTEVHLGFPLRVDHRGRTSTAGLDLHVRDLIEQLLFTAPGERLNRPEMGTHLRQALFAPNSDELAAALEHMIQGALQRWLSEHVIVRRVSVSAEEGTLTVDVAYEVKRNRELREARFERSL